MTTRHRHCPITEREFCYFHCVNPDHCRRRGPMSWQTYTVHPGSHGNITRIETCTCGAIRKTNINGQHIERSAWVGRSELPPRRRP